MNRTTIDLAQLKSATHIRSFNFTWGMPIRIMEVGPYSVLAFHAVEAKVQFFQSYLKKYSKAT